MKKNTLKSIKQNIKETDTNVNTTQGDLSNNAISSMLNKVEELHKFFPGQYILTDPLNANFQILKDKVSDVVNLYNNLSGLIATADVAKQVINNITFSPDLRTDWPIVHLVTIERPLSTAVIDSINQRQKITASLTFAGAGVNMASPDSLDILADVPAAYPGDIFDKEALLNWSEQNGIKATADIRSVIIGTDPNLKFWYKVDTDEPSNKQIYHIFATPQYLYAPDTTNDQDKWGKPVEGYKPEDLYTPKPIGINRITAYSGFFQVQNLIFTFEGKQSSESSLNTIFLTDWETNPVDSVFNNSSLLPIYQESWDLTKIIDEVNEFLEEAKNQIQGFDDSKMNSLQIGSETSKDLNPQYYDINNNKIIPINFTSNDFAAPTDTATVAINTNTVDIDNVRVSNVQKNQEQDAFLTNLDSRLKSAEEALSGGATHYGKIIDASGQITSTPQFVDFDSIYDDIEVSGVATIDVNTDTITVYKDMMLKLDSTATLDGIGGLQEAEITVKLTDENGTQILNTDGNPVEESQTFTFGGSLLNNQLISVSHKVKLQKDADGNNIPQKFKLQVLSDTGTIDATKAATEVWIYLSSGVLDKIFLDNVYNDSTYKPTTAVTAKNVIDSISNVIEENGIEHQSGYRASKIWEYSTEDSGVSSTSQDFWFGTWGNGSKLIGGISGEESLNSIITDDEGHTINTTLKLLESTPTKILEGQVVPVLDSKSIAAGTKDTNDKPVVVIQDMFGKEFFGDYEYENIVSSNTEWSLVPSVFKITDTQIEGFGFKTKPDGTVGLCITTYHLSNDVYSKVIEKVNEFVYSDIPSTSFNIPYKVETFMLNGDTFKIGVSINQEGAQVFRALKRAQNSQGEFIWNIVYERTLSIERKIIDFDVFGESLFTIESGKSGVSVFTLAENPTTGKLDVFEEQYINGPALGLTPSFVNANIASDGKLIDISLFSNNRVERGATQPKGTTLLMDGPHTFTPSGIINNIDMETIDYVRAYGDSTFEVLGRFDGRLATREIIIQQDIYGTDMKGRILKNVAYPTMSDHGVNKEYVDDKLKGDSNKVSGILETTTGFVATTLNDKQFNTIGPDSKITIVDKTPVAWDTVPMTDGNTVGDINLIAGLGLNDKPIYCYALPNGTYANKLQFVEFNKDGSFSRLFDPSDIDSSSLPTGLMDIEVMEIGEHIIYLFNSSEQGLTTDLTLGPQYIYIMYNKVDLSMVGSGEIQFPAITLPDGNTQCFVRPKAVKINSNIVLFAISDSSKEWTDTTPYYISTWVLEKIDNNDGTFSLNIPNAPHYISPFTNVDMGYAIWDDIQFHISNFIPTDNGKVISTLGIQRLSYDIQYSMFLYIDTTTLEPTFVELMDVLPVPYYWDGVTWLTETEDKSFIYMTSSGPYPVEIDHIMRSISFNFITPSGEVIYDGTSYTDTNRLGICLRQDNTFLTLEENELWTFDEDYQTSEVSIGINPSWVNETVGTDELNNKISDNKSDISDNKHKIDNKIKVGDGSETGVLYLLT